MHPSCDRLWQKARDDFDDSDKTWYYNAPVGENTPGNFMASLSKLCRLSHIYTNHSIRAIGATMLAKNNYCDTQIMAVTGHKSVAALFMYQRVDNEDNIQMGKTLPNSIVKVPSKTLALPAANKYSGSISCNKYSGSTSCSKNLDIYASVSVGTV